LPVGYEYPEKGVYDPPPHTHYTEIAIGPDEVDIIGVVIGRGGYYFKKITEAARVHYIFYKPERGTIEIWGPEFRLKNAADRVRRRIQAAKDKIAERRAAAAAAATAENTVVGQPENTAAATADIDVKTA